jgi:NAD+ diphosphatase
MFPQFSISVSMVVTNRTQDKVLLAKHVEEDDFILFAGYIKKGENAEKAIDTVKDELIWYFTEYRDRV